MFKLTTLRKEKESNFEEPKKTEVQLCIIHQVRNTMKYIPWRNYREFMKDLKEVYKASTLELAEHTWINLKKNGENNRQHQLNSGVQIGLIFQIILNIMNRLEG